MRRWICITVALCLSPLAAYGKDSSPPPLEKPPSVILISIDTLRADHLSSYGYTAVATHNIDALAKGGTLFSEVGSQVPLTFPSHVSLFTSTYPFFNGNEDNGETLSLNAIPLAALLKSHGYRTAAVVGGFPMDRLFGLNRGFDMYDSRFNQPSNGEAPSGEIKRLGADVVAIANRWLSGNSNSIFFLFIHFYDLHTPYNLPKSYSARFGTGYDGELRYVDEQVGAFLDFLRQRNLFENSLVVLLADHGESLEDHGEDTHGYFVYQSTIRVPLIVHWPAGSAGFPAKIDEPVRLIDVAPTILEFAGLPVPPEFQGRSLMELLRPGGSKTPRDVYSETLYPHMHFGCSALQALRSGRFKYINAPKPELYDLVADPGETRNIYSQRTAIALAEKEKLTSLRARLRRQNAFPQRMLDPGILARLRSLGYVAGSADDSKSAEAGADPKDRIKDFREYVRALSLDDEGRVDEANPVLERLLAHHPDLVEVRGSLAWNEQQAGRYDQAARDYQQVIKMDPGDLKAHYNFGVTLFRSGKLDEATREFQAALAISPFFVLADDELGSIALQKKDYNQARARFEHVLALNPYDYDAHYNLGTLSAFQEQWEAGERHLRAAMSVDPSNPEAHDALGELYLKKGDLDKANTEFLQSLRLEPKSAAAHYDLGLVLQKQNKPNDAAKEFRQALAIDPEYTAARDALSHLAPARN
ncbi:MAG: sulfatase-like hydrolase/transferase [Terriglobia bacterium]